MSSLPLYLLFAGGWCLGFVMAFITVYDRCTKRLYEVRAEERRLTREEAYWEGFLAAKARAEKEKAS